MPAGRLLDFCKDSGSSPYDAGVQLLFVLFVWRPGQRVRDENRFCTRYDVSISATASQALATQVVGWLTTKGLQL